MASTILAFILTATSFGGQQEMQSLGRGVVAIPQEGGKGFAGP